MINENSNYTIDMFIQECKDFERKYGKKIKYFWEDEQYEEKQDM